MIVAPGAGVNAMDMNNSLNNVDIDMSQVDDMERNTLVSTNLIR